jgi:hypothetical protein
MKSFAVACLFVGASADMTVAMPESVDVTRHSYTGSGSAACFCDPSTAAQSLEVTCRQEEHTCQWNHENHSEKPIFSLSDRGKWRGSKKPGSCTGNTTHTSIRVSHPHASGLEPPHVTQYHHEVVKMHRCKIVTVPAPMGMSSATISACKCCDCTPEAPAAFCWGPKAKGELAYQGVGEGYGDMAKAAAAFRKEKCVHLPGYDEAACRAECDKRGSDCEGIQMKGKSGCTVALKGCLNQGCVEQLPLGTNPYKNGCYRAPKAKDATASWRRRRGGGVAWAGPQQIAQVTGAEDTWVAIRTTSNGRLCDGQNGETLHMSRGDHDAGTLMGFEDRT